jgi:hypothetical protein
LPSNALSHYGMKVSNAGYDQTKFYTNSHQYYRGIDRHIKMQNLWISDQQGKIVLHKKMGTSPKAFN